VVGGDSAPSEPYFEGEKNTKALEYMKDFKPIKCWTSNGGLSNSGDVIEAINNGAGSLFFDGYGNPATWGTHPPWNEGIWVYRSQQ